MGMDHGGDHMMSGDKPMMGEGGMAMDMDKMTEHGADGHQMHDASGDHAMSPEDCQAKHEAMGHDPAEHCPMMTGDKEEAQNKACSAVVFRRRRLGPGSSQRVPPT